MAARTAIAVLLCVCVCTHAHTGATLPPGADIPAVRVSGQATVSGISSGAFMAMQMHVSFSDVISGCGMTAGGPFWCAQDSVALALTVCMGAGTDIPVSLLREVMDQTEAWGFIAPTANLANDRVWLLSAMNDSVVARSVVSATAELYSSLLSSPVAQMKTVYGQEGEHAQLTNDWGSGCVVLGSPYINNCGFDGAGNMLQWLYNSTLTPPTQSARVRAAVKLSPAASVSSATRAILRYGSGSVYEFNQGAFIGGGGWSTMFGLAQSAFVYIPDACLQNASVATGPACTLHVAFHGCLQTQDDIGTAFVEHGGYLPWAEANNVVVLFPQAISNLLNPKGCFDWWGYAGTAYASNVGTQTLTVRRVMDVLFGNSLTPNTTSATAVTGWQTALQDTVRRQHENLAATR